ncbi:MAG: response regulator [Candidatus Sulfobium sp.]|jgi:two-component system, chemotaxis family, chemotaxis protein CheY
MKNKILIVDDDTLIRQLLSLILRSAGYSVVEAVNGKDALDKVREASVNLVITDLRMPQMDGIELARELRTDPEHQYVPIIMLTSDFQEYKKREGEQVGVNSWISKPFIPQRLIHTIREFESDRQPADLVCNQVL